MKSAKDRLTDEAVDLAIKFAEEHADDAWKAVGRMWPHLNDDQQAQLRADMDEVMAAIRTTTVAVANASAVSRSRKRRKAVLQPSTTAVIAGRLVQLLREGGQLTAKELAEKVGTTTNDDDFQRAIHIAIGDGLISALTAQDDGNKEPIHENDELSVPTADSILQSHPLVRMTGQVERFQKQLVDKVCEMGAATLVELRESLPVEESSGGNTDVAFEAALAEVLTRGLIEWVPQCEKLGPSSLFHRRPPLWHPTEPSLYAIPKDKVEREWVTPLGASWAAAQMEKALAVLRTDVANARRASSASDALDAAAGGRGTQQSNVTSETTEVSEQESPD